MKNTCINELKEFSQKLKRIKEKAEAKINAMPEGNISITKKSKGSIGFYFSEKKGDKPRYLTKENEELIKALVNKKYNMEVIKQSEKQAKVIDEFLKRYDPEIVKKEYYGVNESCRNFVSFYEIPNEVFVQQWRETKYKGNSYPLDSNEFITENKERVRSKSELIIANALYKAGVPYRYEFPFVTKNKQVLYPDFTILDQQTRETIIWEHFGRLDNEDYRIKMFEKIRIYAEGGITVGNGLIVTVEDYRSPLNIFVVNQIVQALKSS